MLKVLPWRRASSGSTRIQLDRPALRRASTWAWLTGGLVVATLVALQAGWLVGPRAGGPAPEATPARLQRAVDENNRGEQFFSRGDYKGAADHYRRALEALHARGLQPTLHLGEFGVRRVDHDVEAVVEGTEIRVRHDHREFDDHVPAGVEARHLEVNPDQIFLTTHVTPLRHFSQGSP